MQKLSDDPFLKAFLDASGQMQFERWLADPAAKERDFNRQALRNKMQELFPAVNVIKLFNDSAYRVTLARDFTAKHIAAGDKFPAALYMDQTASYTNGASQREFVAESAENLGIYCDMVMNFEQALLQYQLNL